MNSTELKSNAGPSLVVQWLESTLELQAAQIPPLVGELDPISCVVWEKKV